MMLKERRELGRMQVLVITLSVLSLGLAGGGVLVFASEWGELISLQPVVR